MHTSPRVAFSVFPSERDPMYLAWGRFRGRLVEAPLDQTSVALSQPIAVRTSLAPSSSERTVWRLFASNNREVARSVIAYASYDDARDHVRVLQAKAADLHVHLVAGPAPGVHGWFVELDRLPAATCSRWYPSSSCPDAAASALLLLGQAAIAEASRRLAGGARHGTESQARWS